KPRMNVYADIVLNHVYSDDTNEEINPAVKQYVFDQAVRGGTQYVPYPTNEIKWVIPASAGTGDYYIQIKGYALNWGAAATERSYDVQIDWTGAGFNGISSWEFEPNRSEERRVGKECRERRGRRHEIERDTTRRTGG